MVGLQENRPASMDMRGVDPARSIGIPIERIDDGECLILPALEDHVGHIVASLEELSACDFRGSGIKDGSSPIIWPFARIVAGTDHEKVELGEERHGIVLDERLEKQVLILEAMLSIHV